MCAEMLAALEGYSDVRPRLPKGGPDGGQDMQALFNASVCYGAVGFVNDAADLAQHRNKVNKKFKADLASAVADRGSTSALTGFVFFTNVALTPAIISKLKKAAYDRKIIHCEIFDRERIRLFLDSNRGYAIRLRYLGISMNDAEQLDFFGALADNLNATFGAGISTLERTSRRVQFLLEAQLHLDSLTVLVKLNNSIWSVSEAEFLFQTQMLLQVNSDGLVGFFFGGGNEPIVETLEQFKKKSSNWPDNGRFEYGFSWTIPETPQHERFVGSGMGWEKPANHQEEKAHFCARFHQSEGIFEIDKDYQTFSPIKRPFLERHYPYCKLIELDGCHVLFDCNEKMAQGIESIQIFANGYEVLKLSKDEWRLEQGKIDYFMLPKEAHQNETWANWVRLRPKHLASSFSIDMTSRTPRRYDWV